MSYWDSATKVGDGVVVWAQVRYTGGMEHAEEVPPEEYAASAMPAAEAAARYFREGAHAFRMRCAFIANDARVPEEQLLWIPLGRTSRVALPLTERLPAAVEEKLRFDFLLSRKPTEPFGRMPPLDLAEWLQRVGKDLATDAASLAAMVLHQGDALRALDGADAPPPRVRAFAGILLAAHALRAPGDDVFAHIGRLQGSERALALRLATLVLCDEAFATGIGAIRDHVNAQPLTAGAEGFEPWLAELSARGRG